MFLKMFKVDDAEKSMKLYGRLKDVAVSLRQLARTLAMGQGLAALICGTAITSQYLATSFSVNTPMMQSLFNYTLLCVTYTTMLLCRTGNTTSEHLRKLPVTSSSLSEQQ